jgi:Domain of unknown function (DUF4112)
MRPASVRQSEHARFRDADASPDTRAPFRISAGGTEESVARLEALAKLMDGVFVLPGTNIRMGLDAIIGLVPVAGDMVAGLISTYLIWEARRLGAPRWLIARMMANTLLDTTIGAVPLLGDAFDVMFRANMKNMALLRKHMEKRGLGRRSRPVIEGEAVEIR